MAGREGEACGNLRANTPIIMKIRLIPLFLLLSPGVASAAHMTDRFSDRPRVSGFNEILTADTTAATLEAGEPPGMHGGRQNRSVWAEWVAPDNGWVTIDTAGSFPRAILAIYVGGSLPDLETVSRAAFVNLTTHASTRFPASRGTVYQIALDGDSTSTSQSRGAARVNIRLTAANQPPGVPGNDHYTHRGTLGGARAWGVANNEAASLDPFQPLHTGSAQRDVWWEWTAPATGKVTIDTLESATNTVLVAYSGSPANDPPWDGLDMVARNDDVPNSKASRIVFQTEAGRVYQIAVGGSGTSTDSRGNIILRLALEPNAGPAGVPGTDGFIHRPDLTGTHAHGVACNAFATADAFENVPSGDHRRSVWWSWTAPADGEYAIDTSGSEVVFPSLRIYRGMNLETLGQIASNKGVTGATWAAVRIRAVRGGIYQIRVDSGRISSRGNISLQLRMVPEPEIDVLHSAKVRLTDGRGVLQFGRVRKGSLATRMLLIRNVGGAPLTGLRISAVGANGSFKIGKLPKSELAPGTAMRIPIRFKPNRRGAKSLNVRIHSNDADENPFDIRLAGKTK